MPIQTVSQAFTNEGLGAFSYRNIIINGDMRIAQRGTGPTTLAISSGGLRTNDVDRFGINAGGGNTGNVSTQQITTTDVEGFTNAKRITVTTTGANNTSGYVSFCYLPESRDLTHLNYGSSGAKPLTLSFYVRSSVTGTFPGNIIGSQTPTQRVFPYNITINQVNTWERKVINISGDISGLITGSTGVGIEMNLVYLHVGSQYSTGTANTWNVNSLLNQYASQAKTDFMTQSGATFDITGVQLELGSVATPFEFKPRAIEENLCYRYYYKTTAVATYAPIGVGRAYSTTAGNSPFPLPARMRTSPTISYSALANFDIVTVGSPTDLVNDGAWDNYIKVGWRSAGHTSGTLYQFELGNNTTGWLAFNSEYS
jgi:hypothetical protein